MDISSISTTALEHELRLRQARPTTASTPPRSSRLLNHSGSYVQSDEDGEEDNDDSFLFVRERPSARANSGLKGSIGKSARLLHEHTAERHNRFGQQSRKVPHQPGSLIHPAFPGGPTSRKRRQSPSCEIGESEDELYPPEPSLSAIAYQERALSMISDAKKRRVATRQEEDDRRLAERLAAEEEDDLLMLVEGEWTKARPGAKSHPINLDYSMSRASHRRVGADDYFGVHRNGEAISKQPSRLQSETSDAQARRLHEAASRTRDCAVCGEATRVIDFPSLSCCAHDADICADCYTAWLASQLEENGWQEVKCPGQSCKVNLTYEEIKVYASKEVFERYDVIQARNVLSADPNFRWCRAEGCTSGQIHDTDEVGNEFVCVECYERFCIVHGGPHQDDETCEEYEHRLNGRKERDQRRKEDEASEEAVKSLAKKCPYKKCGAPIQKNGGCNHITCWKCRGHFCYVCLGKNYSKCGHMHLPA